MDRVRVHLANFLLVTVFLSLSFINNPSAVAADLGHWGAGSGKAWKTGFGDCWNAGFAGKQNECEAAPAPAEPEMTGNFWTDDQDRDGVVDKDDACPFTPEGVAVDSRGCAEDYDADGVPDYLDQCKETPLGDVVDLTGCSIKIMSLEGVHFAFDSATLTAVAKSTLDGVAWKIKAHLSAGFAVEGHTDSYGSDEYNLGLSQRRADSVMNYLVSKGVSSSSLTAVGKGESHPVASNDTREGRVENRRVDILGR